MNDNEMTREELLHEVESLTRRVVVLEEQAERYFNLYEHAGDSILLVDPVTLRVVDANSNAARRLQYEPDELLQLSISELEVFTDADQDKQSAWISSFSKTQVYECHYRRKDGVLIPMEVSSRLILAEDHSILHLALRDIHRRKIIEAEREELITDLDAFSRTVAHDLKSMLGMVVGYARLLVDEFQSIQPDKLHDFLHTIASSSHRMSNIVDELLLLANVRHVDDIETYPLNMGRIVEDAHTRLWPMIEEYQPEIILPDSNSWPQAMGYPPWIEEVWVNYISNAMKYGGQPLHVELGASKRDDGMVVFWVRDNGPGIPLDKQEQVFNEFERLDTPRAEGHGLGLSIVRRIIQKLGGAVGLESTLGQGSTFTFTLPAAR